MLALLAAVAAGCGGGGGGEGGDRDASPKLAGPPKAKEPLASAARRLAAELPSRDCGRLIRLMLHSFQRQATRPDAPVTDSECRYIKTEAANELRGFDVTRVADFGTAGFSEGDGGNARGGNVVGIVWMLDTDGSWKAAFEAVFRPQLSSRPQLVAEADKNAALLVAALRKEDCEGIWRGLNVASRFVRQAEGRRERFCHTLPKTYATSSTAFAQLEADPSVGPRPLGRTRDFAYYTLALRNGRYINLVLSGQLGNVGARAELKQHANPSALEILTARLPRK